MANTLDLLLQMDPPGLPTAQVRMKRLSQLWNTPVVFALQGLSYSRVGEIKNLADQQEIPVQILLAGVVSPDLRDARLLEKYQVPTPAELVKKLLLPGEVEDLSRKVEELSGYRKNTLEELKKK